MTDYVINVDEDLWIGVPQTFPLGEWVDGAAWATDVAAAAVPKDEEERSRFRTIALGITEMELPNVSHVLWFVPVDGRAMGLAYVTVVDCEGEDPDLDAVAVLDLVSATPLQLTRHVSATCGEIVQSAATVRLADLGDDRGTAAGVAGSIRTVGAVGGLLFMVNAVDEDLMALGLMQRPMLDLFDCIELLETRDEVEHAIEVLCDIGPA